MTASAPAQGWHARLAELGIRLPAVSAPVAAYVPAIRSGSLVFTSGQLPFVDGGLRRTGKVGGSVDVEAAAADAKVCALNALAAIDDLVGLDSVARVVRVVGYVASAEGFTGQPRVVNGASEFLGKIFGEAGQHARSAIGVAELGIRLPAVSAPVAAYVPAVRSGSLVFTSGQLPFVDGGLRRTGKVGGSVDPEDAAADAKVCALNGLAAIDELVGLDAIVRVVRVVGYVASVEGFTGQPRVVNGASELLGRIFGEAGQHARSAVGVAELPLGSPVEVELTVELRP